MTEFEFITFAVLVSRNCTGDDAEAVYLLLTNANKDGKSKAKIKFSLTR